jgi:hypothetical protein
LSRPVLQEFGRLITAYRFFRRSKYKLMTGR